MYPHTPEQDLKTILELTDGSYYNSAIPMTKLGNGDYYDGVIGGAGITASRSSGSSVSSGSSGVGGFLGTLGNLFGLGSAISGLFSHKSGGERAADYTTRMVNEFLQNPERATNTYNKNTDLTNPYFVNYMKGMTGNGLTDAQVEQNQFNADQAQAQRDWATEMASTSYQRTTADMKAAGLNPAMMYGGNASPASVPNGSAASGSGGPAPSGIAAIAELLGAAASARLARSSSALNFANAFKSVAESRLLTKQAKTEEVRPADIQSQIDQRKAHIHLEEEQAKTEEEKRKLMITEEILNNANADNIEKMRPYLQVELASRSESEKAEASYKLAEAALQHGLINGGIIDKMLEEKGLQNKSQAIMNALNTRNFKEVLRLGGNDLQDSISFYMDYGLGKLASFVGAAPNVIVKP